MNILRGQLVMEPIMKIFSELHINEYKYNENHHYLDGSLFIIKSSLFHKVAGFPNFFMYGEDVGLNLKLREIKGINSFYNEEIIYTHDRSNSTFDHDMKLVNYKKILRIEYSKYFFIRKSNILLSHIYLIMDVVITLVRIIIGSIKMDTRKISCNIYKLYCVIFLLNKFYLTNFYIKEFHTESYCELKKNNNH